MKVEMKQWEIERVKEIVGEILELRSHDLITAEDSRTKSGLSMSRDTFLKRLEDNLIKDIG